MKVQFNYNMYSLAGIGLLRYITSVDGYALHRQIVVATPTAGDAMGIHPRVRKPLLPASV